MPAKHQQIPQNDM